MSKIYGHAYTIPDWLIDLPHGEYTNEELINILKKSRSVIFLKFEALGVEKFRSGGQKNLVKYRWRGCKYYLDFKYEQDKLRLEGKLL